MSERKLFTPEARLRMVELERERMRELERQHAEARARAESSFYIDTEALRSLGSTLEEMGAKAEESSQLMHEMFEKYMDDARAMRSIFPKVSVSRRRPRLFKR